MHFRVTTRPPKPVRTSRRRRRPPRARTRTRHHRAAAGRPRSPDLPPRRRPLPAARRARPRQDAADQDAGRGASTCKFNRIQFTPDLMPSDILGTEVIEEDTRPASGSIRFIAGPGLREHHPRRRDQPHAAAHAGGAARGDAGVPGHGRRRPLRARAAAVRARHGEPDRAGRHASAARGAARSLHVQRRDRLPDARTTNGASSRRRPRGARRRAAAGRDRRRARAARDCWCATCRRQRTSSTTRCAWCERRGRPIRRRRSRCASGYAGARARAPVRRCCSAPRPRRCSTAATRPVARGRDRTVALPVLRHRVLVNFQAEADGIDRRSGRGAAARATVRLVNGSPRRRLNGVLPDVGHVVRRSTTSSWRHDSWSKGFGPGHIAVPCTDTAPSSAAPAVSRRRRPEVPRLEAARADRPAVHAAVPRDDEHVGDARARRQRVDGVSPEHRRHQVGVTPRCWPRRSRTWWSGRATRSASSSTTARCGVPPSRLGQTHARGLLRTLTTMEASGTTAAAVAFRRGAGSCPAAGS